MWGYVRGPAFASSTITTWSSADAPSMVASRSLVVPSMRSRMDGPQLAEQGLSASCQARKDLVGLLLGLAQGLCRLNANLLGLALGVEADPVGLGPGLGLDALDLHLGLATQFLGLVMDALGFGARLGDDAARLRLGVASEPPHVLIEGPHQIGHPSANAFVPVLTGEGLFLGCDAPLTPFRL